MSKLASLGRMIRLIRHEPTRMGDIVVHKADVFFTRPSPALAARMAGLDPVIPWIDMPRLRALPERSFGRAYAEFLDRHGLVAFNVSEAMPPEVLDRTAHWARYALVHDMFHVLLGYGPDLAGEAGVYAFTLAQRYALVFWLFLPLAVLVLPLLAPHRIGRMWANVRRGFALGRQADCLLALRLEDRFEHDLDRVRAELLDVSPSAT